MPARGSASTTWRCHFTVQASTASAVRIDAVPGPSTAAAASATTEPPVNAKPSTALTAASA